MYSDYEYIILIVKNQLLYNKKVGIIGRIAPYIANTPANIILFCKILLMIVYT